jgi:hypothetical protein
MHEALLKAPLPSELLKVEAAKQKQDYLGAVNEMAKPFLAKAIESYRGSISKGRELEAFVDQYFIAIESMRSLDPSFRVDFGQDATPKTYQDWMGLK